MTVSTESVEPFALHLGIIAIAIVLGIGLQEGLMLLENTTWGKSGNVLMIRYLPLFPLAMIGGVIVQIVLQKLDKRKIVDRKTIARIRGLALDLLIVSAIGSLSLTIIGANFEVFLILAITGIVWNLFMFVVFARRMLPKYWFERGIGDFGQSMGMTAIGIMLIRITDPDHRSKAMEVFGYKQLLFEPFVGGGIMTAISVPLIAQLGLVPVVIISASIMSVWLFVGLVCFGRKGPEQVP